MTKHRIICKMLKIEFNLEFCNLPNRSEKKINTFSYIPRLRDFTTPSSSLKCRREDAWVHTFSRDPLRSCDGAGAVWSQGDPDLGFSFLPRARHCASLPSQTPSQPCRGLCRGWGKKKNSRQETEVKRIEFIRAGDAVRTAEGLSESQPRTWDIFLFL